MTEASTAIGGPMAASTTGMAPAGPLGSLDGGAFLRLLIAQLRNQNPFQPMDTSQMLQQTAALTTVESLQQLAQSERMVMGLMQASMAASLVGKEVTGLDAAGERVTGIVSGVRFTIDGPVLAIGEHEVPIGKLVEMRPVDAEGSASSPAQG